MGNLKMSHNYDNGFFVQIWMNLLGNREMSLQSNNLEILEIESKSTIALGLGGGYRF